MNNLIKKVNILIFRISTVAIGFLSTLVLGIGVAYADSGMQLRGKYFACQSNQKMNLWDISGSSPLIRDDMVRKNYCWKTMPGIRIEVLDYVGKFARVNNGKGLDDYLVYASDVEKVPPKRAAPTPSNRQTNSAQLIAVKTRWPGKILFDLDPNNTVEIRVKFDKKFQVFFYILRSEITEKFDVKIDDQFGSKMQVNGFCDEASVGVWRPDFYRVKVASIDQTKKRASLLISLYREKCSLDSPFSYSINDAEVVISGSNFTEMMRPYTKK